MSASAAPWKRTRSLWKNAWQSALGSLAMVLVMTAVASAYWTAPGTGGGSGSVGTLGAPTITGHTPGAGTVALSWSAVAPPGGSGSISYYVQRDGGNPGGNCPISTSPTAVVTCTDSGLSAGDYTYTVTAVWYTWTATSSPATQVTLASGALDHFVLSAATTTPTAGQTDNLTITAQDAYGNTVTAYTGSHSLTFAGAGTIGIHVPTVTNSSGTAINFGTATAIDFTAGVATVSGPSNGVMTLYKVETANITVTEGGSYTSSPLAVTVSVGAMSKLSLAAALTTVTAGQTDNLTITAQDAYGNTVTAYTGSHSLTFAGAGTIGIHVPTVTNSSGTATNFGTATEINFTAGVATVSGSSNGVMRLYKVETANITVAEGGSYTSSPLAVTVSVGAMSKLSLAAALTTVTAGVADNLTITAQDAYGNTVTSYTSSHSLTFAGASTIGTHVPTVTNSSGTATNFGTATPITFTAGVATVSGANNGVMTLYKVETANITVAEGGSYTSSPLAVTVTAAAAAGIVLYPITQDADPSVLPCSGSIGAVTCVSDHEGNSGYTLTAKLTLADQFGNAVANNSGSPIGIDLATTGQGTVAPFGANALWIPNGLSETSASFTLIRDHPGNKTVKMTATVHGTSQTLTVTLSF